MKFLSPILLVALALGSVVNAVPHQFMQHPFIVQETNALLNAAVVTGSSPAHAWFEWSHDGGPYSVSTSTNIPSGPAFVRVTSTITNVFQGTYICRLVVSNAAGVSYSNERKFTPGGRVVAWGRNYSGSIDVPAGCSNVVSVSAGGNYSLALKADGKVVGWGDNSNDQANPPARITNVVAIAAGWYHSLALRADETVTAWGAYQGTVKAATNVAAIASRGAYHNLAARWDGNVVWWGFDQYGEGNVPASATNVVAVAAGLFHTMVLRIDGTVVCWGAGKAGQTEPPHFGQSIVPVGLTNVVAIAASYYQSLALKRDGTIVTWGGYPAPPPPSTNNIIALSAGENVKVGLKADGTVLTWPTYGPTDVPPNVIGVISISSGGNHVLGVGINCRPWGAPQLLTVVPAQEVRVILAGGDANRDPLRFRILSLPVSGKLYQWQAGARGGEINTPNTELVDTNGTVVFVAADDAPPGTSAFSYTVSDGELAALSETVEVNVVHATPPLLKYNGPDFFMFYGTSNVLYRVWGSSNLLSWELLGEATLDRDGSFYFRDPVGRVGVQRFYRVSAP